MTDYRDQLKQALASEDRNRAVKAAQAAFSDPNATEEQSEPVAGLISETKLMPVFPLLLQFVKRFPESLGLPRVYWAGLCLDNGHPDEAIYHARVHLRLARDLKAIDHLDQMRIICTGVTHAFAYLAAGYSRAGARSYAARAIKQGLQYKLSASLRPLLQEDMGKYVKELAAPKFKSVDDMWEGFFLRGDNAAGVEAHCRKEGFDELAQRVELIEAQFRYDKNFRANTDEIFLLTARDNKGTRILK